MEFFKRSIALVLICSVLWCDLAIAGRNKTGESDEGYSSDTNIPHQTSPRKSSRPSHTPLRRTNSSPDLRANGFGQDNISSDSEEDDQPLLHQDRLHSVSSSFVFPHEEERESELLARRPLRTSGFDQPSNLDLFSQEHPRRLSDSHPLLLTYDDEEGIFEDDLLLSREKDTEELKYAPYPRSFVAAVRLSPGDIQKAWRGNARKQADVIGWVNHFARVDPALADAIIRSLRFSAQIDILDKDRSLKDMRHWALINAEDQQEEQESFDVRPLLRISYNEDIIERGLGMGGKDPFLPLPEGWDTDPAKSKKILKFLRYLEKYTYQDQTTWLQWGGMALLAAIGGLAAWPDVPVFSVGFDEIVDERLKLDFDFNQTVENTLIGYVLTTAVLDNVPRMAWCARRFLAPSTQDFSLQFSKAKKYGFAALVIGGAVVPTLVQVFYLVDAEKTIQEWGREQGVKVTIRNYLITWGPFYAMEAAVWSLDQLNNFKRWAAGRFFKDKIPKMFPSQLSRFRSDLLNNLDGLEKAFYWMPDEQVQLIYNQVFDPHLLNDVQAQAPHASKDQWECMMGFCRLRYLTNMANDLEEDFVEARSGYKKITEWLSMGSAVISSGARLLALQIVFQLMFSELSGGYISQQTAEVLGWVCSATFGLVAQGAAEVIGGVDFFHDFLWNE